MKMKEIRHIAALSGTSPSTVSKALHHCSGVSAALRQRILTLAEREGIAAGREDTVDVYVILPDTPAVFWGEIYRAMEAEGISCKQNLYSALYDDPTVILAYLREAQQLGARAVILAAPEQPELAASLAAFPPDTMILFLCEYWDRSNAFYVGSDPISDGRWLADEVNREPTIHRLLALTNEKSTLVRERVKGFCAALRSDIEVTACAYPTSGSTVSARLARRLHAVGGDYAYDAVFCPDGIVPEVIGALVKLRPAVMPRIYGFDTDELPKEIGGALLCQDLATQGKTALRFAQIYVEGYCYPPQKRTYVRSALYRFDGKRT